MRKQFRTFEERFFQYEIPQPIQSLFDEQLIRSNDLRLLLEIATRSSLRMYTDPKNGNLHFICKQRGANCYDIQAERHPQFQHSYYFTYSYLDRKHLGNCHQMNEAFSYLQIYNLMKLKKRLIEEFMIELKVEKYSPSIILNTLSEGREEYFFEKYINGNLEFKRKLRKRFDNIVNIDIKKIGNRQQNEQIQQEQQQNNKITATDKEKQKVGKERQQHRVKQKQTVKQQGKNVVKEQKSAKSKKINKKYLGQEKQNSKAKKEKAKQVVVISQNKDDSPLLMEQEQQMLPQIRVLNEQAEYIWSSSESESGPLACEENMINALSNEDYFKSLRNSLLNKSLERQSLTVCLFSSEPGSNNKENK